MNEERPHRPPSSGPKKGENTYGSKLSDTTHTSPASDEEPIHSASDPQRGDENVDATATAQEYRSKKRSRPLLPYSRIIAVLVLIALIGVSIFPKRVEKPSTELELTQPMPVTPPHTELITPTQPHGSKKTLQQLVPQMTSFRGDAMEMPYHIMIGDHLSDDEKQRVWEAIEQALWKVHCIYNHFNTASELSKFNRLEALTPMTLSPELEELFVLAGQMHQISNGYYDPSVKYACEQWRDALNQGRLLSEREIESLRACVGWHHMEFGQEHQLCKLSYPMEIDFSSLAKGRGVDMITEAILAMGHSHVFVDWGGEIRVHGQHPLRRDWKVGIKDPTKHSGEFVAVLNLTEGAVATSGHSEQYWSIATGERTCEAFSHLINPLTLEPLRLSERTILSCTVTAPTCALADGLATTGVLFNSLEEAMDWAKATQEKWPSCEICFFTKDGKLWRSAPSKSSPQSIISYK